MLSPKWSLNFFFQVHWTLKHFPYINCWSYSQDPLLLSVHLHVHVNSRRAFQNGSLWGHFWVYLCYHLSLSPEKMLMVQPYLSWNWRCKFDGIASATCRSLIVSILPLTATAQSSFRSWHTFKMVVCKSFVRTGYTSIFLPLPAWPQMKQWVRKLRSQFWSFCCAFYFFLSLRLLNFVWIGITSSAFLMYMLSCLYFQIVSSLHACF